VPDLSLAFTRTYLFLDPAQPANSRLASVFRSNGGHRDLGNNEAHRLELEQRIGLVFGAGSGSSDVVTTDPIELTAQRLGVYPNAPVETAVSLGPVLQPAELVLQRAPELVFKIAPLDGASYLLWDLRIRYRSDAPVGSVAPVQVIAVRIHLNGSRIMTAPTFEAVNTILNFQFVGQSLAVSSSAMVLGHGCGAGAVPPCGDDLSFSFAVLQRVNSSAFVP
jgi:hypothetical protein